MKVLLVLSLAVCAWGATLRPRTTFTTTTIRTTWTTTPRPTTLRTTTPIPGCSDPHDGSWHAHDSYYTDSFTGGQCHCLYGQAQCEPAAPTCEVSPCVYGTCTDDVMGYTCTCESGWEGFNCDQNIDDCASSPCAHGNCTDGVASYTCSCENGWEGTNCDQDIDECASNPCLLGGTCLDHVDGYSCVCPKDATGKNCDTVPFIGECYQFSTSAVNHRDATQACSTNDGRMVDLKDEQQQQFLASTIAATTNVSNWLAMKTAPLPILYSDGTPVRAPLQWSADEPSSPLDMCVLLDSSDSYKATTVFCTEQHNYVCQDELKPCEPNVCQNGGNCTSCFGGSTTFCDCLDGFEGKLCEINTDECVSNPCQHGGSCLDQVNSYRCRCPTGYSGDNCETEIDWCAMVTCPFDWTCQNLITHFSCLAPIVRMLEPYKCSSASCPGDMHCREDSDASFSCWAN
ncbi:uncharacterized protein LOC144864905 isoform X2 [Branchiostoma floridae x Branchiostoma japonicum]